MRERDQVREGGGREGGRREGGREEGGREGGISHLALLAWGREGNYIIVAERAKRVHRRRKRGGEGATRPPKFQVGGASPPPPTLPTVYIMNFIAVL